MTIVEKCPHKFNQSNLRFLVKNTLLNNSYLERFNTVCIPFPMERYCFTSGQKKDIVFIVTFVAIIKNLDFPCCQNLKLCPVGCLR